VEGTFAGDDIGSDNRTIEDVYRAFPYGARNGWRRRADPKLLMTTLALLTIHRS